ncbi:unnamed protein product [Adineta steineri]|uniref:Uncharacterized protein n=1 Tax=Adineta steineri TaxID=433720 RepID=A0A815K9F2_9BILA|nr:unnamed protein product [Adineta steineri]CAF1610727.1 unnamed protein product [Adineta steineri]
MNSTVMRRTQKLPSNNLFNNIQRSHTIPSGTALPVITLSSFFNFEKKLIQMATDKSNMVTNTPIELSTAQTKARTPVSNRLNSSSTSKSSFNYPTTVARPATAHSRNLYVTNSPMSSHRPVSARAPTNSLNPSPRQQQQQEQSSFSRPTSEYGHYLTYVRRQSLARMRRKQEEEEKHLKSTESKMTLNLNRNLSPQQLQSTSNDSDDSLKTDTLSVPTISIATKRTGRSSSTYRQLQRSTTNYHTNQHPKFFPKTPRNSSDGQLLTLASSSLLITPTNSMIDDINTLSVKTHYDVHLNDDKLNYCYISDDSGVVYQGEMLST